MTCFDMSSSSRRESLQRIRYDITRSLTFNSTLRAWTSEPLDHSGRWVHPSNSPIVLKPGSFVARVVPSAIKHTLHKPSPQFSKLPRSCPSTFRFTVNPHVLSHPGKPRLVVAPSTYECINAPRSGPKCTAPLGDHTVGSQSAVSNGSRI